LTVCPRNREAKKMVKRDDRRVAPELDKKHTDPVINHAILSGRSRSTDSSTNDDVIVSLADAYENRRAQQVNEWEKRQHVAKAF
jgi:hypothetical protein